MAVHYVVMMSKKKAIRRYCQSPDKYVGKDKLVDHLLGDASPDHQNGSHALLSEIVQKLRNVEGLEQVCDELYCGLMGGDHFAESRYSDKYRLITVGVDVIKGVNKAAKLYLYMDVINERFLRQLYSCESQAGKEYECVIREFNRMYESYKDCISSSMSHRKSGVSPVKSGRGMIASKIVYYLDGDINKYCRFRSGFGERIDYLTKGALVWTVCHEVAHEMHVNASKKTRVALVDKLGASVSEFLFERSDISAISDEHIDEYLCDHIAYDYILKSQIDDKTKLWAFVASQLVCAVMAVREGDAADADVSADTHPHPLHRVVLNQMAYLEMLCEQNEFCLEADEELVRSIIFARFVAGYYTLHEDGFKEFCFLDAVKLRAELYKYLIDSDSHFLSKNRDELLGGISPSSS